MIKIARKNNGTSALIPVECGESNLEGVITSQGTNDIVFGPARVVASSTAVLNELGKELLKSAYEGNADEIKNLLTRGAPFSADWLGTSPLHLAAQNNHVEVCELLLRAGISIDARTKVDRTPLHMASYEGHLEIVKILVKNDADINCRDLLGMTPLHWATQNCHFEIVEFLVESGADINATNKFTLSATDIAAQVNRNDIIEYINSYANDSTIATQNLVLQLQAQNEEENNVMEITEESSNEDDPRIVPPVESIFISTTFENDAEQSSCIEADQQQTIFASPVNISNSESIYVEDEPMSQNIPSIDDNGLSESAIRLLQEHGLTMIQTDNEDTNILNTVMESGHSVVLTDIGREVLNSVKQSEEESQLPMSKRIITITPEEFLAMTNGVNNKNNINNNHAFSKIKVLPVKKGVKRVVMKKNRVIPVTNISTIHNEVRDIHGVSNSQKTDVEQVMAQLIEAKKTIEEYKIKLQQKEQEAERYKMQLKLLLNA